jgi:hypothetical protein
MKNFFKVYVLTILLVMLSACGGGGSPSSSQQTPAIDGYLIDYDNLAKEGPSNLIAAGESVYLAVYGQNLHDDLKVELGDQACEFDGIESYNDEERDSADLIMYVMCPTQASGNQNLTVYEGSQLIYSVALEAIDANTLALQRAAHLESLRPIFDDNANGISPVPLSFRALSDAIVSRDVTGTITADRPSNNTKDGSLDYGVDVLNFPVRGALVQLIDPVTKKALKTVATNELGKYTFTNVAQDQSYLLQVSSQLAKTRAKGVTTGPQYNFMVRDNTIGKYGDSKPLYILEKSFTLTQSTISIDLNATLGFDSTGKLIDAKQRQSAAFAILDVLYNAANGIEIANPNIFLADLHIYWSPNNRTISPDSSVSKEKMAEQKMAGKIKTSHFQSASDYPGLFILGEINVDTDEFDRGVVGHEFGHYLQFAASYDASPGGGHESGDFKDPSLSFSEGFGTAIGGLLAKSQYYTDSRGENQQLGSITDLLKIPTTTNGFYSEDTIAYFLYQLGLKDAYGAFTTFWNTLTSMTSGYQSSTIFSFLDRYIAQGKATKEAILIDAQPINIRTVDPLGILPAGDTPDPKINSATSGGADDLEKIYISLAPKTPADAKKSENLTPSVSTFCLNSKLLGANHSNGLGMSRRFAFMAPYTGSLSYKLLDEKGNEYKNDYFFVTVRNGATGKNLKNGWNGYREQWDVVSGNTYSLTITFNSESPQIKKANLCGNQFSLWNFVE